MKVAIAKENNRVSGHFGHCEGFEIYHVENNRVVSKETLNNPAHKPGLLPRILSEKAVDIILAGGMGVKAQQMFKTKNIEVVVGVEGLIDKTIEAYINGEVTSTDEICREHRHRGVECDH